MPELQTTTLSDDDETEFLTPEQRFDILADILSTIALRIVKERHEQDQIH